MINRPPSGHIERHSGVATWESAPWDSELIGYSAAKLGTFSAECDYKEACKTKAELITGVLRECQEVGINYLLARIPSHDLSSVHVLEAAGFQLIEGLQTFRIALDATSAWPPNSRLYRQDDLAEVLEIARSAFAVDRFHCDPAIAPENADQVSEEWTRNCCLGTAAEAVVIATIEARVASYVCCRLHEGAKRGTIVLVATAEWARNQGAGRRSSRAALSWFSEQGIREVEIGTQLTNISAARLYESVGFRLVSTSYTFRKLL